MANIKSNNELGKLIENIDGSTKQDKFLNFLRWSVMCFYGGYNHKGKENILPFEQRCIDTFNRVYADKDLQTAYNDLFKFIGEKSNKYTDALGDFYQSEISHGDHSQFFTPINVCDLMAEIVGGEIKGGVIDSACGCGRTLLSAAKIGRRQGNLKDTYFVGVDIDERCVLMTLFNLCINTLQGEVVWGNALTDNYHCACQIHIMDFWRHPDFQPELAGFMPRYIAQWTLSDKPQLVKEFSSSNTAEQQKKETKPLITEKVIKEIKKKAPQVTEQEIKQIGTQLSLF